MKDLNAAVAVASAFREAGFDYLSPAGQAYLKERLQVGACLDPERGRYNLGGLKNLGFAASLGDAWQNGIALWMKTHPAKLLPVGFSMTPQQRAVAEERVDLGASRGMLNVNANWYPTPTDENVASMGVLPAGIEVHVTGRTGSGMGGGAPHIWSEIELRGQRGWVWSSVLTVDRGEPVAESYEIEIVRNPQAVEWRRTYGERFWEHPEWHRRYAAEFGRDRFERREGWFGRERREGRGERFEHREGEHREGERREGMEHGERRDGREGDGIHRSEPGRGEPGRGESSRGEPSRGEPGRGESGRGEPGRGGGGEPGHAPSAPPASPPATHAPAAVTATPPPSHAAMPSVPAGHPGVPMAHIGAAVYVGQRSHLKAVTQLYRDPGSRGVRASGNVGTFRAGTPVTVMAMRRGQSDTDWVFVRVMDRAGQRTDGWIQVSSVVPSALMPVMPVRRDVQYPHSREMVIPGREMVVDFEPHRSRRHRRHVEEIDIMPQPTEIDVEIEQPRPVEVDVEVEQPTVEIDVTTRDGDDNDNLSGVDADLGMAELGSVARGTMLANATWHELPSPVSTSYGVLPAGTVVGVVGRHRDGMTEIEIEGTRGWVWDDRVQIVDPGFDPILQAPPTTFLSPERFALQERFVRRLPSRWLLRGADLGEADVAEHQEAYRTGRASWLLSGAIPSDSADRVKLFTERRELAESVPNGQVDLGSVSSVASALHHTDGWRLFLYTWLGTWIVGSTGRAIGRMLHGASSAPMAEVHVDKLSTVMDAVRRRTQRPAAPAQVHVGGVEIGDGETVESIEALAAELGSAYDAPSGFVPADPSGVTLGAASDSVSSALQKAKSAISSAASELHTTSGWRLFLYAMLGAWAVGTTGKAIGDILHGPSKAPIAKIHVDTIRDVLDLAKQSGVVPTSPVVVVQSPAAAHPPAAHAPAATPSRTTQRVLAGSRTFLPNGGESPSDIASRYGALSRPNWLSELKAANPKQDWSNVDQHDHIAIPDSWGLMTYSGVDDDIEALAAELGAVYPAPSGYVLAGGDDLLGVGLASFPSVETAAQELVRIAFRAAPRDWAKVGDAEMAALDTYPALTQETVMAEVAYPGLDADALGPLGFGIAEDGRLLALDLPLPLRERDLGDAGRMYTTSDGDTPHSIAEKYDALSRPHWAGELSQANPAFSWVHVYSGQQVKIPSEWPAPFWKDMGDAGRMYTTNEGDTPKSIAEKYDALSRPHWAGELSAANPTFVWTHVYSGQKVKIPAEWPTPFWKDAIEGTPVLSPLGWCPGRGPSPAAEETFRKLSADWESFDRAGVGEAILPQAAPEVVAWRETRDAWKVGTLSAGEIGEALTEEIERARGIRRELRAIGAVGLGADVASMVTYVKDLPSKAMASGKELQHWLESHNLVEYNPASAGMPVHFGTQAPGAAGSTSLSAMTAAKGGGLAALVLLLLYGPTHILGSAKSFAKGAQKSMLGALKHHR